MTTYDEAKAQNLKRYDATEPCARGHMAPRFTINRACTECSKISRDKFKADNPHKTAEYNRRSREKNPDAAKAAVKRWADKNLLRERERAKVKRQTNPEYYREKNREWYAKNKAWSSAKANRRKAMKAHATPVWADEEKIMALYLEAERLTNETGVPHHVDHIFPLINETSCGLHVETNLRVVPWRENLEKSNRLPAYDCIDGQLVVFLST